MQKKFSVIFTGLFIGMFFILLLPYQANAADVPDAGLEEEIKALKKEIQSLRKDVEDMKAKNAVRQPVQAQEPQEVIVSLNDDPVKGNSNAPVTIIEFSDFQCPYCGRHFRTTMPDIEREYIKTGKVKYIFRDFPLEFHQYALKAAEAADCAGEQEKYWEMHDKLFENQADLKVEKLKQYATEIGLDSNTFDTCLDSGKYAGEIQKDVEDGKRAGVSGTPTFFIGKSQDKSKEIKGKKVVGALPYQSFKQIIDPLLEEQK